MKHPRLPAIAALFQLALCTTLSAGIANSPEAAAPLAVGAKAPAVNVVNEAGASVALADVLGGKPTVLIFYRGGWCPFCNKHLASLSEIQPELVSMGYRIVAISPDPIESLKATTEKHSLHYQLYSDTSMAASGAFGVAFRVDDKTVERYKEYHVTLPVVPGDPSSRWLPVPSAFVIAADGTIRFVHSNPDYRVRIEPAALIEAARDALK